ncbi:MAG: glycosyltransferase family 4 protein [Acidimicrobiales bacterium]
MTPIRVGVNLLWLQPGAAGGSEDYVIRLLRAMAAGGAEAHDVELTLLCNRRFPEAHPELAAASHVVVAPVDGSSRPRRILAESTWVAAASARRRFDVVHHTNQVLPPVRSRRSALTVHDLRPLVHPDTTPSGQGRYLRARFGPSVRAAAVVMTPSEFVRQSVIERLRARPERVLVVSAPLLPTGAAATGERAVPYFIYPAVTQPHKNHLTLLRAFAQVCEARSEVTLALPGGAGAAEAMIAAEVARLGLDDRVERLGRIPRLDLDRLISGATALVYPSRYEGFGIPLAEAMALGCPVIAADATALPEVVGDAGILVDPGDVEGWATAMLGLVDDEKRRAELAAAGRDRVRSLPLTPSEAADRLAQAYRLAAAAGGGRNR